MRKRTIDNESGTVRDVIKQHELLGNRIVKPLSKKGVSKYKKLTVSVRKEFFVSNGFVWQFSMDVCISENVLSLDINQSLFDVQEKNGSSIYHMERIEGGRENVSNFTSFMHDWASFFKVIATCDVNTGGRATSRRESRSITGSINLLQDHIVM